MTLTPKQENFCMAYIETGNASEAYRQAYDSENMKPETINRKAKELMDNGKISARIEVTHAEHRERHAVTVDSISEELEEARAGAIEIGQHSAAVQASMGKAKLHGLLTDKVENKLSMEMTPEKADEILRGIGIEPESLSRG